MGIIRRIFGKKETTTSSDVKVDTSLISSKLTPYIKPGAVSDTSVGKDTGGTTFDGGTSTRTTGGGGGGGYVSSSPIVTGVKTGTQAQGFTGKVSEISGGKEVSTTYMKGGKEVGRLFSVKGEQYAETKPGVKSAFFTFDTLGGTKRQEVELGGETGGARISEYEMMIGGGDIRPPTQAEVLGTGGLMFLTGAESKSLGIDSSIITEGGKTAGQRSTEYTESLMGFSPGTSGMVALSTKDIMGTSLEPVKAKAGGIIGGIVTGYGKANKFISDLIPTEQDWRTQLLSKTSPEGRELIESRIEEIKLTESKKDVFWRGMGSEIYADIQEKPLKQVLIFGVGAGLGAGLKGAGLGIKAGTEALGMSGVKAVQIGEAVVFTGGVALAGSIGFGLYKDIKLAGSPEERGRIVGSFSKDFLLFGAGMRIGSKGFDLTRDWARTRGTTKLLAEDIIAPEFYKGQTYPKVKKGTTAGQLKKEFYQDILPSETGNLPRGFTASPMGFGKETLTGAGSSEVKGLFSAPKLSPAFFGLEGESGLKLFSPKGTLLGSSPTAMRLTFKDIEFAPGVSSRTKVGTGKLGDFKNFFENIRGTGRTILTGTKTEKEVITAFDSPIFRTAKDYSFDFQGRKIPIPEYSLGTPPANINPFAKVTTLGKTLESSSYYSPKNVLFRTSDILSLGSSRGRGSSRNILSSSSVASLRNSLSSGSSSMRKGLSSSYPSNIKRRGYGFGSGGGFGGTSYGGRYTGIFGGGILIPPPKEIPFTSKKGRDIFGGKMKGMPDMSGIIRGERLFIPTVSFGVSLGKQMNLDIGGVSQKGLLAETGLVEKKWGTTKLPTTVLWKTQKKEFETFPKIKSYMKSVI